jgi:pilus assembly protein CpaB
MRPKSLLLLALALGCGLVASIGISQVMDRPQAVALETTPVYVAKHNINLGDPIAKEMLVLQEWPKDKVPRGAIANLEDLEGRRPRTAIIEGEPILEGKLLEVGQVADPITQIPKGMRLKTVAVDAEKSAGGLLGPGDRVDVQLFVRKDQRTGIETAKSKVILQNIRIFAVDQTVQRSPDGGEERSVAKTVSLMLTPEQANKLTLAEQIGEISLIPRNPDDDTVASWDEVKIEDLLGSGEANSREKEQGEDDTVANDEPSADGGGLFTALQNTLASRPPFRMEIVLADNVTEMLFDSETGRPIRQPAEAPSPAGPQVTPSSSPAAEEPGNSAPSVEDAENALDDFPIDFNVAD